MNPPATGHCPEPRKSLIPITVKVHNKIRSLCFDVDPLYEMLSKLFCDY
jgi:hypothetical protein